MGNFIGMLPEGMAGSRTYGVEIDSISGRIAQQLYQNSQIAVNGFEKVQMPDSFFDVAVGIHVLHSKATGEWNITNKNADSSNVKSFTTYGTKRSTPITSWSRP